MSANYGITIDINDTDSVETDLARFEPSVSKGLGRVPSPSNMLDSAYYPCY
jgi:hypothetical protein